MMRLICKSRTYQLSVESNRWNSDDKTNYSHAIARRLPAEVLYDALHRVTGTVTKLPGVPAGTRAAQLPDSGIDLPSGFFTTFGRPARESACECERTSGLQLGPVMALISGPTIGDAIVDPSNELTKLVTKEKDNGKLVDEIFHRVLNRPATSNEVNEAVKAIENVDVDHNSLVAVLARRDKEFQAIKPRLEKEREAAIATATADLARIEKERASKIAEDKRQWTEALAQREKAVKDHEASLPAKLTAWEKQQSDVEWMPIAAKSLKADIATKLRQEPDRSIVASERAIKSAYTIVAETSLQGIKAVRLEVLADSRFPAHGPGRASDGNFVLTEFQVSAAPKSNPTQVKPVTLQNALADFSQIGQDIKAAIDGDADNPVAGWAIMPLAGMTHWATYETKEPVGHDGGTVLTFTLHQSHTSDIYEIGRFRISVTTAAKPGLTLPEELRMIVAAPVQERTTAEKEALMKYFRAMDMDLRKKTEELAKAKSPLPPDPVVAEARGRLEYASRPVQEDPNLSQLRRDVEMSTKQMSDRRLTAAQDVVWALINSPEFLFNH
jgi:hypothetical protein